ncbi:MAG: folylpolyglutamate synthase/dihydrofolate synthase family protein [Hyphomonadaceae bacterium]
MSPAFGLEHIRAALKALGDPQDRIPRAVHVTGTNGKGSTGAFLRGVAEASGLGVHVFTSPHLLRVNERIRVAGELVGDDQLLQALDEVAFAGASLTYFEALTAAAFLLFARSEADLSIIEVGAGGALDATNVMAKPAVCVVTPISRDHEAMFGLSGEAAIARLKAGIMREGVPVVVAEQTPIVMGVLREEARKAGASVLACGKDWRAGWDGEAFEYVSGDVRVRTPWLGLRGRHQAINAGTACAVAQALGDDRIDAVTMAGGLREAVWPARMQRLGDGPATRGFNGEIWVDGAHNPGGAGVLATCLRDLPPPDDAPERTVLVIAMQAAKDASGVVSALAPAVDEVIACALPDSGGQEGGISADAEELATIARALGKSARAAGSFEDALRMARSPRNGRIVVAGSLYLCGAAMRANGEQAV